MISRAIISCKPCTLPSTRMGQKSHCSSWTKIDPAPAGIAFMIPFDDPCLDARPMSSRSLLSATKLSFRELIQVKLLASSCVASFRQCLSQYFATHTRFLTFAGDQTWKAKVPEHGDTSVPLSKFEKHGDGTEFILWSNTWNHLLGESNNNPDMEITYQHAQPAGGKEHTKNKDFVVRKGSRADVDARFKGLMTSVSAVMTPEREKKLGKRLM